MTDPHRALPVANIGIGVVVGGKGAGILQVWGVVGGGGESSFCCLHPYFVEGSVSRSFVILKFTLILKPPKMTVASLTGVIHPQVNCLGLAKCPLMFLVDFDSNASSVPPFGPT